MRFELMPPVVSVIQTFATGMLTYINSTSPLCLPFHHASIFLLILFSSHQRESNPLVGESNLAYSIRCPTSMNFRRISSEWNSVITTLCSLFTSLLWKLLLKLQVNLCIIGFVLLISVVHSRIRTRIHPVRSRLSS